MIAVVTFLVLLLLGLAVSRWGADSRDGRDWQPRTRPVPPKPVPYVPRPTPDGGRAAEPPALGRAA